VKILALDIETAPNLAHVWRVFKENVGVEQILESGYVLSWSAKWIGSDDIFFDSINQSSKRKFIRGIHKLLDAADAVIHYNGTRFDIPHLNREFLLAGINPPSPYKQIDLLKTVKKHFSLPTYRLQYVSRVFGLGSKVKHEGHELWIKCMNGEKAAWEKMEEYNKQDVHLLEALYNKLGPWITNHANYSVFSGQLVCPRCGSEHYQSRGHVHTNAGVYNRFQCNTCGHWFRGNKSVAAKEKMLSL
jgi:DNA polymerase elongation subunit (family B)